MLQCKDINKISELKNGFTHSWLEPEFILSSLKCFSFSSLCKGLNSLKIKGYSFECVISILISLPFTGLKTINHIYNSGFVSHIEAKKDVFYRLKNNPVISWRFILWMFSCKFRDLVKKDTANNVLKCLVFDDTLLAKTGKCIEKVSFVWDHVLNRCILGYKLMLMGYWDGTSLIPLDFSLHRERGKNKEKPFGLKKKYYKRQYSKQRKPNTHSSERAHEVDISKIESMLKMFKRAISHGFIVDYVLADSWFTCESLICAVKNIKKQTVHLIGMFKIAKAKFNYNGKSLTYKQILNDAGKAKRCRKLKLHYKQAQVIYKEKSLQLFFSRQGKNGKWKVLLTTDLKLSFIQMIEIYQIRWTIEVCFKEAKQLLGLGNCQSNDFDAQIADVTITMIQYILLTLRFRYDIYETKGKLFEQVRNEYVMQRLNERLWGLFQELMNILETLFDSINEMELFEKILNNDQAMEGIKKIFCINDNMKNVA